MDDIKFDFIGKDSFFNLGLTHRIDYHKLQTHEIPLTEGPYSGSDFDFSLLQLACHYIPPIRSGSINLPEKLQVAWAYT